ncbi:hypothetical protein ACSBR1_013706 [Camellia fascicularis]
MIQVSAKRFRQHKVLICKNLSLHSIDKECHVETLHQQWGTKRSLYNYIRLFGSCNGLLLINIYDDLFLWNSLTRCSKKVLSYNGLRNGDYRVVSRLCYDSSSNDYMAVMALAHQTPSYGGEIMVVGNFKNKSWTRVHFPYSIHTLKNTGTVVNEHLHWFVSEKGRGFFSFLWFAQSI